MASEKWVKGKQEEAWELAIIFKNINIVGDISISVKRCRQKPGLNGL